MGYSKVKFEAPDVNRYYNQSGYNFSEPSTIKSNVDIIVNVDKNYGEIIDFWGSEFDIPNIVINCFICTESSGKNAPKNAFNAIGLMQITPETVYEIITKWNSKVDVPLSSKTKGILSKYVPKWKDWNSNVSFNSVHFAEISKALKIEEFNIAMGSANLRWLLEAFSSKGVSQLNKVMIAYNKGYYSAKSDLNGNLTTEQILKIKGLGKEPKGYLLKMLGVDGFLYLWNKFLK